MALSTSALGVWGDQGDFYVNSWNNVVYYGTARVYINVNGTYHYKYTI